MIELQTVTNRDRPAIRRMFWATFVLGRPLPALPAERHRYEELCLGWYLTEGRQTSAIATIDGVPVGYVLVCTAQSSHRRHQRTAATDLLTIVAPQLLLRRLDPFSDRFYRLRFRDGLAALPGRSPASAHAHFNLVREARRGLAMRKLVEFADECVADAGHETWFGEMNARDGTRRSVLERYGARVVRTEENRTLSWLTGRRVDRLVVVRQVGEIARLGESA